MRVSLAVAIGVLALMCPALGQTVMATKLVSYGKGKELLRKINGRWRSQDNREVYPPGKGGVFWELDSEPGVVDFYHHRPFDPKAESLHLFMAPPEVEAALGQPNRIFKMGPDGGMWSYYAANGTRVEVRSMDGVLGEAKYDPVTGPSTPVASVARDLNGRSIYTLLAERAGPRSAEEQAKCVAAMRSQMPTQEDHGRRIAQLRSQRASGGATGGSTPIQVGTNGAGGTVPAIAPAVPESRKQIVSPEALARIKIGASRADVLAVLGEPSALFH